MPPDLMSIQAVEWRGPESLERQNQMWPTLVTAWSRPLTKDGAALNDPRCALRPLLLRQSA